MLEVPTGSHGRNLGSGHLQTFLPIWLQKSMGKWTAYGGGGYWINPGAHNRNWCFTGLVIQHQVLQTSPRASRSFTAPRKKSAVHVKRVSISD